MADHGPGQPRARQTQKTTSKRCLSQRERASAAQRRTELRGAERQRRRRRRGGGLVICGNLIEKKMPFCLDATYEAAPTLDSLLGSNDPLTVCPADVYLCIWLDSVFSVNRLLFFRTRKRKSICLSLERLRVVSLLR